MYLDSNFATIPSRTTSSGWAASKRIPSAPRVGYVQRPGGAASDTAPRQLLRRNDSAGTAGQGASNILRRTFQPTDTIVQAPRRVQGQALAPLPNNIRREDKRVRRNRERTVETLVQ
jgi:hypothetical protein